MSDVAIRACVPRYSHRLRPGEATMQAIDTADDVSAATRRFGSRRNIYMAILGIGFWLGFPQPALFLTASWGVITLGVHVSRIAYHLNWRMAPA